MAVVPVVGRRVVIYIADYRNNRVRMVGTDGRISTVLARALRVAVAAGDAPGGWLYVANDNGEVTAVNVNKAPLQLATVPTPTDRRRNRSARCRPQALHAAPAVVVARKVT